MFTKTYYAGVAASIAQSKTTFSGHSFRNAAGSEKNITNVSDLSNYYTYFRNALGNLTAYDKGITQSTSNIVFGNGDVPVTKNDFQLSGNHFTNVVGTVVSALNDDLSTMTYTYTLTNGGTSAFTIKEVGVFSYASGATSYALLMREVLATPVTIEAGGIGQVTLTFKLNIPES